MKCAIKVCNETATGAVTINVPAMNIPLAEHDPIRVVLGILLCDKCLGVTKASEFLHGEDNSLRKVICIQTKGRADPDFDRAFVSKCDLESEEYKILSRGR